MFKKLFGIKTKKERFEDMASELKDLPDEELKEWYSHADTNVLIGDACKHERDLLRKIDKELSDRGFKHMIDY